MNSKPTKSWKPGQSGNPKGAPKREWTWDGVIEQAVEEAAKDGKPIKYHIARSLVAESLKGNIVAIKELMNRMDGMPKQQMEHSGSIEHPQPIYGAKSTKK